MIARWRDLAPAGHWQSAVLQQLQSLPGYADALGRCFGHVPTLAQALACAHPTGARMRSVSPHQGHGVAGTPIRPAMQRCGYACQPVYLEPT